MNHLRQLPAQTHWTALQLMLLRKAWSKWSTSPVIQFFFSARAIWRLGYICEQLILTKGAGRDRDSKPKFHGYEPSALSLSYPIIQWKTSPWVCYTRFKIWWCLAVTLSKGSSYNSRFKLENEPSVLGSQVNRMTLHRAAMKCSFGPRCWVLWHLGKKCDPNTLYGYV